MKKLLGLYNVQDIADDDEELDKFADALAEELEAQLSEPEEDEEEGE